MRLWNLFRRKYLEILENPQPPPIAPSKHNRRTTRRGLLKAIGLVAAAPSPSFSQANASDEALIKIEQQVRDALAKLNNCIARQSAIEQAVWKAPAEGQLQRDLDLIEQEIDIAQNDIVKLINQLVGTAASSLIGLQVKARLEPYGDGVSISMRDDILAMNELSELS